MQHKQTDPQHWFEREKQLHNEKEEQKRLRPTTQPHHAEQTNADVQRKREEREQSEEEREVDIDEW